MTTRIFQTLLFTGLLISLNLQGAIPEHTRLLYENSLKTGDSDEFMTMQNIKGSFRSNGWQAERESKLTLQLYNRLPATGTVEFSVTNFDPVKQAERGKQTFFGLSSEPHTQLSLFADDSHSAFAFLRIGTNYVTSATQAGLEFDTAFDGPKSRERARTLLLNKTWDRNRTYQFRLVWNQDTFWLFLDGEMVKEHFFSGPVRRFQYISISGDDFYYPVEGPIYSDLKIYTAESRVIFDDKTFSKSVKGLEEQFGGNALASADVNGDGLGDIFVTNIVQDQCLSAILYVQLPDHSFQDESSLRGIDTDCNAYSASFADIDNDGDLDLYVCNYGSADQLYINDGTGNFSEQSGSRGLVNQQQLSTASLFFDLENDGDLDLLVIVDGDENIIYLNDGQGFFQASSRGIAGTLIPASDPVKPTATALDIDNDGDMDIYVNHPDTGNELYINDGQGHFTEQAQQHHINFDHYTTSATFADMDTDGDMDLLLASKHQDYTEEPLELAIYANDGTGHFTPFASPPLLMNGYRVSVFDANNDGYQDIYCLQNNEYDRYYGWRAWEIFGVSKAILYLGEGNGQFTPIDDCGTGIVANTRTVLANDFDRDGDQDLYITTNSFENVYLENNSSQENQHWVNVSLKSENGQKGAIGTKVKLYQTGFLGDKEHLIGYQQILSQNGYLADNSKCLHFGLGEYHTFDIAIEWPDGNRQTQTQMDANEVYEIQQTADPEYELHYVAGNHQTGNFNSLLGEPLAVRVTDGKGANAPGVAVHFGVTGEGATLSESLVYTDDSGIAQVQVTTGNVQGTIIVEATLPDSPHARVSFTAYVNPVITDLEIWSGNHQTGTVGQALPEEIVIQTMANGQPLVNQNVLFSLTDQTGSLQGETQLNVLTDAQGFARVNWTLGVHAGQQTLNVTSGPLKQTITATALAGAPSKLLRDKGEGQELVAPGQTFAAPFGVKVVDTYGNPIENHPVTFNVTAGGGSIQNLSEVTINTDSQGVAHVYWTVGPYLGPDQTLEATSESGGTLLQSSPVQWSYKGLSIDSVKSTLVATFPVPADGKSQSQITLTLYDNQGQAVGAGVTVFFASSGTGNIWTVPDTMTNEQGKITAFLASTTVEMKTITATVKGLDIILEQSDVQFIEPAPEFNRIERVSGNHQQGTVGKELAAPLTVKVMDSMNNPVSAVPVVFQTAQGSGSFNGQNRLTVHSDPNGLASAVFQLGTRAEDYQVTAFLADSLDSFVTFSATAVPAQPSILRQDKGAGQTLVSPGQTFPEPFGVKVTDVYSNAISDHPVSFSVISGGGTLEGQTVTTMRTDSSGCAQVYWTTGSYLGPDQVLQASSKNNGVPLELSPITWAYKGLDIDMQKSRLTASTPVPADGTTSSKITVTLLNSKGTFVGPGITVHLTCSGTENTWVIPDPVSDENGQIKAFLTSTKAETKTITALIKGIEKTLPPFQVDFIKQILPPGQIVAVSGNQQHGIVGEKLTLPLIVKVLDSMNNPVASSPVTFTCYSSGGSFSGKKETTILSDADGSAAVDFTLGTKPGNHEVTATHPNIPGSEIKFTLIALADSPRAINIVSGNDQTAQAGVTLPDSFRVQVVDQYENPTPDQTVVFISLNGGKILSPEWVQTNNQGFAACQVALGDSSGIYYFMAQVDTLSSEFFQATALSDNQNGAPSIVFYTPAESSLVLSHDQNMQFTIIGNDPDGDNLFGEWWVNDEWVANGLSFLFQATKENPDTNRIRVLLSDGELADQIEWTVFLQSSTSVDSPTNSQEFPQKTALIGNYPNPFNPETTIEFQCQNEKVDLRIIDSQGRQVALLLQEILDAGTHRVTWNAAGMPSGIYFYQLLTDTHREIQKMILLR
ncbi:T9SS type A sorting domain-containing protein [candidate division KSB1 bacterium]|nr:T9SS type A sorting domain-containing protein [candidate division KSB1 bacterium]